MKLSMPTLVAFLVVCGLFHNSLAQTNHTVGDSTGWRTPSGGAATYSTWASQQNFVVGDALVFKFAAGSHDVAEVTKAAFDGCTTAPISTPTNSTSPATVFLNLNSAGQHYFVCTFSGHCAAGQKLSIFVSSATSPPTPTINSPPTPTINTPPTPTINSPPTPAINSPPAPSSSTPLLSALALPLVALLSIVITFFH